MRIGIDISQIVHQGTGVATYTRELVTALLAQDKTNDYVLFGTSLRKFSILQKFAASFAENSHLTLKFFPLPPALAEPLFNGPPRLNIELFTGNLDVLHTSDWLEPRARCPKVTVVHDLAMFKFPDVAHPKILSVHRRKLYLAKRESSQIIAVSQSTKNDLVQILGFDPEKVTVIYESASPIFRPVTERKELEKYGIRGKYLLALGTREPRKNLTRVIDAFTSLDLPETSLVIVGKFGWGENLKPVKNVIIAGYIPQEDLPAIYSASEVFVYPALYEGFGLPVLEAMSCGVPVVTSNVSSLPEVAGDAAVKIDPNDSESIALGIKKAIAESESFKAKGFEQSKRFSWSETARQTLSVYNYVTGLPKRHDTD